MELYNLGKVPWEESQLVYHALADLGREALVLLSPETPYVCIGFHQDVEAEVDLDYCRNNKIPVFRREVGGGAVYLDGDQLFFQLILSETNPIVPVRKESFYRKFLQPVIDTYRRIGIPAEYKPINDIVANGRKISGTGVGEIGNNIVFVGNLILDFNFIMMSRILKVPDEKFRDKVHKTMTENMTTIRRELGEEKASQWNEQTLNRIMIEEFQKLLGPFTLMDRDEALMTKMEEIGIRMTNNEWFFQRGRRFSGSEVKISAGVKVIQREHKAPGGLIRAVFEIREGCFADISISGDFFCYPSDAIDSLTSALMGTPVDNVPDVLEGFYSDKAIETPGVGIDDWLEVFKYQ